MSKGPKPTDEETGQEMRALAEIYRTGVLEETGVKLGWGDADAVRLDQLCTAFLATRPKAAVRRSMIMALGAYLGELIVRQTGGRWVYDEKHRAAAFVTPQGLRGFPHNKVAKRLDVGEEHQLWAFYVYAAKRELTPGTVETPWKPTAAD